MVLQKGTLLYRRFERLDQRITALMARYGIVLMRIGLGIVFVWFGALKYVPGLSPAQNLAERTIDKLSLGLISGRPSLLILATWEILIGLGLLSGKFMRTTILLLLAQMVGTVLPIFFFPHQVFLRFPYAPTLEGQYIIKNMILVCAALVIGATVRGGRVITEPEEPSPKV